VISSSQRPLPDNTQHSQQTNIHAPRGIQTQDLSGQAAADLRLRQHSHWDWLESILNVQNIIYFTTPRIRDGNTYFKIQASTMAIKTDTKKNTLAGMQRKCFCVR
jgi:hypothetical protein